MKNIYQTETFDKEHRHFGGLVYLSDFNTEFRKDNSRSGSPLAERIEADFVRERKSHLKRSEDHA